MQPQADAGESEDSGGDNVIDQHRNDQSSRSAALRVIARQQAGDTEREQRRSRDATEGYARTGNFGTEQQPSHNGGEGGRSGEGRGGERRRVRWAAGHLKK